MKAILLSTLFILLCCNEKLNGGSTVIKRKVIDKPLNNFENAWYKRDTLKIINYLDSLKVISDSNFIYEIYRFSQVSGLGIALIDITDSSYFLKSKRTVIMKENLLGLIHAYSNSKYFMKEPCEVIMFHKTYDIFDPKLKNLDFNKVIDSSFNKMNCFVEWEY